MCHKTPPKWVLIYIRQNLGGLFMKKLVKKVIPVILSIIMLTVFGTSVMASDVSTRNTLINGATCSITDKNNDTASILVDARAISSINQIDFSIEVQKKGFWGYSEVETINRTYNDNIGSYKGTVDIDSSKSYRLRVTYTVHSSSSSETVTKTSKTT